MTAYGTFEEAAEHFVGEGENHGKTEGEILSEALAACPDDKLTEFLLRLLLSECADIPRGELTDWLTKAEGVFAPPKPKAVKAKDKQKDTKKPVIVPKPAKKTANRKKAA